MSNFLFLGGDMRFVYAAKKMSERYDCFLYGFDDAPPFTCLPVLREITKCGNLVLPLPASRDGFTINAPFSALPLPLSIIPQAVDEGGTVYCGRSFPELERICKEHNLKLVDYFEREELAVMNAVPTAEGTLELAIRERKRTIFGSEILISGFGRISKVLAKYLTAMGADVTITARKYSDLAWAEIAGCKTVHLSEISGELPRFDIVINTVPSPIFGADDVKLLKNDCLVIDLASKPGFEDAEEAKKDGVKVVWALSLPGKTAPETAGYIIANTIINIIAENA